MGCAVAAGAIVRALGYGSGGDTRIGSIEPAAWGLLGLTPSVLDCILDVFDADLDRALNYAVFD